ncbi:MAG TPA: hypothetical protein VF631_10220 [Allosphingosinicella sp.]|jgi:uncharacterized protein YlxW (UPF0749 family)|uniref:hypothetical protein n=1 Tax=Allosphingosinicella sp. TaxID=2823234 RepID=UPI002F27366A
MNPLEMVVAIVLIVTLASVWKAKYGIRKDRHGNEVYVDNRENQQLRDEVKQLKDRLAVLEQITIEKENSLSREIERLRDR